MRMSAVRLEVCSNVDSQCLVYIYTQTDLSGQLIQFMVWVTMINRGEQKWSRFSPHFLNGGKTAGAYDDKL